MPNANPPGVEQDGMIINDADRDDAIAMTICLLAYHAVENPPRGMGRDRLYRNGQGERDIPGKFLRGRFVLVILGVDLAARVDSTALVWLNGWTIERIDVMPPPLEYPEIIERLREEVPKVDYAVADASGIGDPICSQLRPELPNLIGVRIIGGKRAIRKNDYWHSGKEFLVNTLLQALSRKKLKITAPDPGRSLFRKELDAFRQYAGRFNKFEAVRGKAHDDVVIAAALAVFGKVVIQWQRPGLNCEDNA